MATSNHTDDYNLSQYAAGDPVKFLTNYNQDMAAIDAALKAIHDSDTAKTPQSRTIAGLPLSSDLTLAQLIAAGLCSAPDGPHPWTPILYGDSAAGNPTYTVRSGTYYKIGKIVFYEFIITISSLGGITNIPLIGGLPFAGAELGSATIKEVSGESANIAGLQTSAGRFVMMAYSATSNAAVFVSGITDSFHIRASGWYLAN